MSRTPKQWFLIGLGFGLLAAIGYFLFKAVEASFSFLQSVNPTVGAAIVAAVATVMVGLYTQYVLKKRQMDDAHREKKILIYEEFMKMAAAIWHKRMKTSNRRRCLRKKSWSFYSGSKQT